MSSRPGMVTMSVVGLTMVAALAMFLPASNTWFARSAGRS